MPRVQRRTIPGFGGKYSVDSRGNVYSGDTSLSVIEGRYVNLCDNGHVQKVNVAYLVARAFVANSELRPYVVHLDGDTKNNAADNLEWSEVREGRRPKQGKTKQRKVHAVFVATGDVLEFDSVSQAAAEMGLSRTGIMNCLKGKQKTCGGLTWYE